MLTTTGRRNWSGDLSKWFKCFFRNLRRNFANLFLFILYFNQNIFPLAFTSRYFMVDFMSSDCRSLGATDCVQVVPSCSDQILVLYWNVPTVCGLYFAAIVVSVISKVLNKPRKIYLISSVFRLLQGLEPFCSICCSFSSRIWYWCHLFGGPRLYVTFYEDISQVGLGTVHVCHVDLRSFTASFFGFGGFELGKYRR